MIQRSGAGEAHHFLAFSQLSFNESRNPLSSLLGAPVFGGALQLFISRGRRRAVGIKAEFAVDAMICQQKWRFEDVICDVEVVFDAVGGETLDRSWNVLKTGGRVVTVATASGQSSEARVRDAFMIVRADDLGEEPLGGAAIAGTLTCDSLTASTGFRAHCHTDTVIFYTLRNSVDFLSSFRPPKAT